ncbi:hypothetical protein Plec18167_003629 [Paecilomyces lecythidis]|uniref:UBX domain-containing protein n=1 Tax=Paecilomyces lecythidis TaxID=3004212 RepID=A0ABR3XYJ8_9EURO
MSSHVVVIDSTARRATVKTTPNKHLADILQEACAKLNIDANQYGLKHKSKQLDLSLSFRLSGLSSGAKLELVQASRSPSVVTVGLQLPESEAQGVPNGRILDKFPSNTTLWLVLRKFEAGVAGDGKTRNLTGRGAPATDSGSAGAGRLYYQTPVLQIMGRELASFTDLQKSLAQLGYNSGNVLMRLSFRTTPEPLEEAMHKIGEYFQSFEDKSGEVAEAVAPPQEGRTIDDTNPSVTARVSPTPDPAAEAVGDTPAEPISQPASQLAASEAPSSEPSQPPTVSSRPVTVYRPPSSSTPQSAQTAYDESDYVPSVEHAKSHQDRLNISSRPTRLPTDAEIAAKAAAEQQKLASIKEIDVKVRFPDQSQVVAKFGQEDTGKTLYDFVRGCLDGPFTAEKFNLSTPGAPAPVSGKKSHPTIPETDTSFLIRDLGMKGRVLVNFSWDPNASVAARSSGGRLLKPELRSQAQDIKVEEIKPVEEPEQVGRSLGGASATASNETKRKGGGTGGVPKWLKLPGKK